MTSAGLAIAIGVLAATGATLAAAAGAGTTASTAGPAGKVVFASDRSGGYEIHTMSANGTGISQLTSAPGDDDSPTWSPDGKRILFTSVRDHQGAGPGQGTTEIYVMNADGSAQTRLTSNTSQYWGPRWSPDGSRIVWASNLTQPGTTSTSG